MTSDTLAEGDSFQKKGELWCQQRAGQQSKLTDSFSSCIMQINIGQWKPIRSVSDRCRIYLEEYWLRNNGAKLAYSVPNMFTSFKQACCCALPPERVGVTEIATTLNKKWKQMCQWLKMATNADEIDRAQLYRCCCKSTYRNNNSRLSYWVLKPNWMTG